jgi:phage-related protein
MKDTAAAANAPKKFSLSGIMPAIGQMNLFQKAMMAANVATTFAEPLLAGVTVAAGGIASSLAAAGGGLGIFAVVAKGAYAQVSQNIATYTQAQYAAAHATTAAAKTTALKQMQGAWNGLTASQKDFAKSIVTGHNEWNSFVTSATPGIDKLVHQGLGLLPSLLSDIRPVLAPVEGALHGIVGDLGKSLQSGGLKTTFQWIAANAPQAITGLAHAIGNIATGIGGMLRAFTPASHSILHGLDDMTAKFAHWGTTLGGHSGFQSLMSMFKSETPLAVHALGQLGGIIKTVVSDMTGLDGVGNSKTLLQLANPVLALTNALLKANPALVRLGLYLLAAGSAGKKLSNMFGKDSGFASLVTGVKGGVSGLKDLKAGFTDSEAAASAATGIWGTFGGKISTAVTAVKGWGIWSNIASGATKVWTGVQAAFNMVMDMNPVVLVVAAVALLAVGITLLIMKCKPFREFWIHLWHDVTHIVGEAVSWIKGHWKLILTILTGPIGAATIYIIDHFSQIRHWVAHTFDGIRHDIAAAWDLILHDTVARLDGVRHWIASKFDLVRHDIAHWGDNVLNWFKQLPGRIVSALGNLSGLLVNAGESLMKGLLHGIASGFDSVRHFVAHIADDIASLKGPLPKDRVLLVPHGQAIMTGLLSGLDSRMPELRVQMAKTTAAITGGVHGAAAASAPAGGGGAPIVIEVHAGGGGSGLEQMFMTWLANSIRAKGGDQRILVRKVKFA